MLRIVGLQRSDNPDREFVLLQNQGSMRVVLRGYVLMSESAISTGNLYSNSFVFADETAIPSGVYVLLFTGNGEPRWTRTKDGAHVFQTYIGQDRSLWSRLEGPLHIMRSHHSYSERLCDPLLVRH